MEPYILFLNAGISCLHFYFAFDSKGSLVIDNDTFLELKENHPKQSCAIYSEGPKLGSWKGSEIWRNRTDCLIYIEKGITNNGLDKNRWIGKGQMMVY